MNIALNLTKRVPWVDGFQLQENSTSAGPVSRIRPDHDCLPALDDRYGNTEMAKKWAMLGFIVPQPYIAGSGQLPIWVEKERNSKLPHTQE